MARRKSRVVKKRRPRDCGCYVFRVRKPGAFWGWPIIGRHFGYVGEGYSRKLRETEHLKGSTRFQAMPKDWVDLEPSFFRLPGVRCDIRWLRKFQETLWIWLLIPVYNTRKQPFYNLRRVSTKRAAWQRMMRDKLGLWYKVPRAIMRWSLAAVIMGLTVWINVQQGWW